MSKTERALDRDVAALGELDDFVAAEVAAADRAIGELIPDGSAPPNGNGHGSGDDRGGNGHGGLDELDVEEIIATDEFDTSELDSLDVGDDDIEPDEVAADRVDTDRSGEVDLATSEVVVIDELVETDEGIVDDEVAVAEPVVASVDTDETAVDDSGDLIAPFPLPPIVIATPDADEDHADAEEGDEVVAREGDFPGVSDDILEELRRADIDGPIVDLSPQDDTTSARRRPKRRPDYDPAPVPIPARPPRILGRKPRVRKVTRIVRHVDPWSVFKIATLAFLVLYVVVLTASVLLWNVAYATGTIDNLERFFESFGWSSFEFNGGEIYHAGWIAGLFAVVGFTGLAVLGATLFNLITDIVGGVRFTVLEEEVVETRTSPMRRFVVRRPEPVVPTVISDSSGAMIREAVVDDSGAIER